MERSVSVSASSDLDSMSRRRSGRVVRAPEKFTPPVTAGPSKRKRDDADADDEDDEEPASEDDASSGGDGDAASDGDHPAPRTRKPARATARKPSSKKPKINGSRPAPVSRMPSRPKRAVRIDPGEKGTGLFAQVFSSEDAVGTVAQQWLQSYRQDEATAMSNMVNCFLQCAGCHYEVSPDDINDPDNIPSCLVDLQNMYQEKSITEYPLISKSKTTRSFRDLLVSFFHSLFILLHETDVLYKKPELHENLHAWLASMSSSPLRPFRHTATTIALAVQTGLVHIAGTLDRRIATIDQQSQAVKKTKNKSKASEIERSLTEANRCRQVCNEAIQSFFDTVFVHRYRDVDARIRTECVEALGSWIWQLPTVFMEPSYLRYLGWMLSDINAATRQEVLKQLLKMFKRDAQQLGHFIDRFRPRLIEIATLDVDVSVRVAAISVIDSLRAAAMLEPDEIDAIGKLIFDSELRIRKAVVHFFVACIHDAHEAKVEEMGGTDVIEELEEGQEDDYESPRKEWIRLKCLAETLAIYHGQIEDASQVSAGSAMDIATDLLIPIVAETRISLAAQVLYEKVAEVKTWELLAGYLLFDHTTSSRAKSMSDAISNTPEMLLKRVVAPSAVEETILLEVLGTAIKSSLGQAGEHEKSRRKGQRSEAVEAQEETALELTSIIPKLLSKYGAEPDTAVIVLRLEHSLNLDVFQQLRQDGSKYVKLLDEITTQFIRHSDTRVVSEAALSLMHARQYEELEELVDSKLSLLWEHSINVLRNFDEAHDLSTRNNLGMTSLGELCATVMKMSKLAGIHDCLDVVEAEAPSQQSKAPVIELLSQIVHRGRFQPETDEMDDLEDELAAYAIKACQLYFMWKTLALSKLLSAGRSVSDAELFKLKTLQRSYRKHLIETFSSRAINDEIRLFATGSLCDLHLTFATLRSPISDFKPASSSYADAVDSLRELVMDIETGLMPEMTSIFESAEKLYAKLTHKAQKLNEPLEDEDPVSDEDEDSDADSDADDSAHASKEARLAAELRAEKALCSLTAKYVMVLRAGLVGPDKTADRLTKRLMRNRAKLGHNFKEVVAYLDDDDKPPTTRRAAAKKSGKKLASPAPQQRPASPADHMDVDEDHGHDDDDDVVDDDDPFEDVPPVEGSAEDLHRRELLDDEPEAEEHVSDVEPEPRHESDDVIMGD